MNPSPPGDLVSIHDLDANRIAIGGAIGLIHLVNRSTGVSEQALNEGNGEVLGILGGEGDALVVLMSFASSSDIMLFDIIQMVMGSWIQSTLSLQMELRILIEMETVMGMQLTEIILIDSLMIQHNGLIRIMMDMEITQMEPILTCSREWRSTQGLRW